MLSDRCLYVCPVCLSVTLVYCGQMVGWIKMKLGMCVGLGPGHIVLDWNPAERPSPKGGGAAPVFYAYLLWKNGWMDQDATWQGSMPQPKRHCVRWGPSSPLRKAAGPPIFGRVYCGQTARWIKMPLGVEVGLGPGHIVLDGDPALPPPQPPIFGPYLLWPNGWIDQDATW